MRRAALAILLVVLLALTGCGGGNPKPKALPSHTATAAPTPSPSTPTPPALPSAAAERGRAGAVSFVQHYVDVLNYATFTGDVKPAQLLDAGQCTSCDRMLEAIAKVYRSGGSVKGGAWTPRIVSDVKQPSGKGWTVDAKVTYGPQSVIRQAGQQPQRFTGGGRLLSFILELGPGGWRVAEWTRAS